MNREIDRGERVARYILGFSLHAILGSVGSFAVSMLVGAAIVAVVPANRDSLDFISLSISSVLIVFLLRFKAGAGSLVGGSA